MKGGPLKAWVRNTKLKQSGLLYGAGLSIVFFLQALTMQNGNLKCGFAGHTVLMHYFNLSYS